jgi:hypothetical protein
MAMLGDDATLNSDVFTQQGELGNEEDMGTAGNTK